MISVAVPVTCLVASVFTYGMMVQRKEWLVFKSSGLSLYRLALPILFVGLFMSIGSFFFENNIVIKNNKIKNELNWSPKETFDTGIRKTIQWYLDNEDWWRHIQDGTYNQERLGLKK